MRVIDWILLILLIILSLFLLSMLYRSINRQPIRIKSVEQILNEQMIRAEESMPPMSPSLKKYKLKQVYKPN